jgi:hypothetical protein
VDYLGIRMPHPTGSMQPLVCLRAPDIVRAESAVLTV